MFTSIDEYRDGINSIIQLIGGNNPKTAIKAKSVLNGYGLKRIPDDYTFALTGKRVTDAEKERPKAVSLAEALKSGSAPNSQKLKNAGVVYTIDVETGTGAKVSLALFKGDDLNIEYVDGEPKVYGIIIDMNCQENKQFIDLNGAIGRVLELKINIPTIIIAPKKGRIHGVVNYSNIVPLKQEIDGEDSSVKSRVPADLFVDFNETNDIFIPIQDADIKDLILYSCISKVGKDYTKVIYSDQKRNNIRLGMPKGAEQLEKYRELRDKDAHFEYLNRELEGIAYFYAENQTVDTLRIDITSELSTSSYSKGFFTASADFKSVKKVITVIPPKFFDDTDFSDVADLIKGIGFKNSETDKGSDIDIYLQYEDESQLEDYITYHVPVLVFEKLSNGVTKVTSVREQWDFNVYMVDKTFKFCDVK